MSSWTKSNLNTWDLDDVIPIGLNEEHLSEELIEAIPKSQKKNDFPLICLNANSCYQLKDYLHALQLCNDAIRRGYSIPPILMIKGRCLYCMEEYETALESFEAAHSIKPSIESSRCIERCKAKIAAESEEISRRVIKYDPQQQPNIQKEWYQSSDSVSVTIFIKNLSEKNVTVIFNKMSFNFYVAQRPQYTLHFNLVKAIVPEECTFTVSPTKVEIKLKKLVNEKWETLETF